MQTTFTRRTVAGPSRRGLPLAMASIGQPIARVDGRAKVTGAVKYVGDEQPAHVAHAYLVRSTIAHGTIKSIDTAVIERLPGVLAVLTHHSFPKLTEAPVALKVGRDGNRLAGSAGQQRLPLQDDRVLYPGEPVALVVADTFERARDAARRLPVEFVPIAAYPDLETQIADDKLFKPDNVWGEPTDHTRGDPARALADAAVKIEATYHTALQHHVTMEPHATVAAWAGERLTIWEPTTWVYGTRTAVATWFGLKPDTIRVRQQVVGGSFGSKGPTWPHVALCVAAAKHVGRPVKLVLSRQQTFTSNGYRPRIRHDVKLAATREGKLTAVTYDAVAETSVFDDRVAAPVTNTPPRVYACPSFGTTYRLARLNRSGPFTFRGPGETPGQFAYESAIDELAYKLKIDPLTLRRINHADIDPHQNQPWSSKHLLECYDAAAARFGWAGRDLMPGGRREGDDLIGTGCATMIYDARSSPAKAEMSLAPDGRLTVRSATSDNGVGSRTALSQLAADAAGVPFDAVHFELGDTDYPMAPIQAASQTTASVGWAVTTAGHELRRQIAQRVTADRESPLHGVAADSIELENGQLRTADGSKSEPLSAFLRRQGHKAILAHGEARKIEATQSPSRFSFGVHMAEVRVDATSGRARVSRYVAAFAAGRIINPRRAHSQLVGGIIWGVGQALMEQTHVDPVSRRLVNEDLAEYLVPTHADMTFPIDAFFVDEHDTQVNPLGVKGVGEIGTIGSAAAIANAVFHATGRRVRPADYAGQVAVAILQSNPTRDAYGFNVGRPPY